MKKTTTLLPLLLLMTACGQSHFVSSENPVTVDLSIDADSLVNVDYIGNGVQWDPYILDYGKGKVEISDADWQKLYARLDYMRPAFIRMMQNTEWQLRDGVFDPLYGFDHLKHLLDYCQSRRVTVMFGDWGGLMVDPQAGTINETLLAHVADYMKFLLEEKGYDCIKYYNLINEPNGSWSTTRGDYELWARAMKQLYGEFERVGIEDRLTLVGPDAAIWSPDESWWVSRTRDELGDMVGLYDIHTYPSKATINSGEYSRIIASYKAQVPEGHQIVMGEIGIKFVAPEDAAFNEENIRRANACPHASKSDSQMFVHDVMYGTDMADALFQTINNGFSGSIVWMLDDAMHTNESPDKLKIWGFWNILGDEYFGAGEEIVRPWYYAWSLLCRYLPAGSDFNLVKLSSGTCGVKAISAVVGQQRTVALVNVGKEMQTVQVSGEMKIPHARIFRYGEGLFETEGDHTILPQDKEIRVDLNRGIRIDLPGESLVVITNVE